MGNRERHQGDEERTRMATSARGGVSVSGGVRRSCLVVVFALCLFIPAAIQNAYDVIRAASIYRTLCTLRTHAGSDAFDANPYGRNFSGTVTPIRACSDPSVLHTKVCDGCSTALRTTTALTQHNLQKATNKEVAKWGYKHGYKYTISVLLVLGDIVCFHCIYIFLGPHRVMKIISNYLPDIRTRLLLAATCQTWRHLLFKQIGLNPDVHPDRNTYGARGVKLLQNHARTHSNVPNQ